ncbi:hypothetical protein AXF42_Ash006465 [Apostasia shenzhenica]|uniref:Uncharacterized protein n=1 Tax=Apostasia shenzhenica TaxID=1088818 RepID=A0A2I0AZ57_9ASPA|nr:hypothetical protein AXF42_Ash006465 [Apostasia shenzhenica]
MDSGEMVGGAWTEERHNMYLSWLEANFVRQLFRRRRGFVSVAIETSNGGFGPPPDLRLDRFVPDSATESTRPIHGGRSGGGGGAVKASAGVKQEQVDKLNCPSNIQVKGMSDFGVRWDDPQMIIWKRSPASLSHRKISPLPVLLPRRHYQVRLHFSLLGFNLFDLLSSLAGIGLRV